MNDNRPTYTDAERLERGLTRNEAAAVLGYDYTTVCRMVKAGEFDTYGAGKKLRIYESSINRYRQRTRNMFQPAEPVRDAVRRTGPRFRRAMQDLESLLGDS